MKDNHFETNQDDVQLGYFPPTALISAETDSLMTSGSTAQCTGDSEMFYTPWQENRKMVEPHTEYDVKEAKTA